MLKLLQVDESHAGVYTCTPHNELGSAGASEPMKVLVQRPPVFTLRPASLYVRRVGDGVDMACAAAEEGNPEESRPPTITWIRVKMHIKLHCLLRIKIGIVVFTYCEYNKSHVKLQGNIKSNIILLFI